MRKSLTDAARDAIASHVADTRPGRRVTSVSWPFPPANDYVDNFTVLQVAPNDGDSWWMFVSSGASAIELPDRDPIELVLLAPANSYIFANLLSVAIDQHADPDWSLGEGSIIKLERPWMLDSNCDHLLVSRPYPLGASFEWVHVSDEQHIRVLWLLPITLEEARYSLQHGLEELEQVFDRCRLDYLDYRRPSTV